MVCFKKNAVNLDSDPKKTRKPLSERNSIVRSRKDALGGRIQDEDGASIVECICFYPAARIALSGRIMPKPHAIVYDVLVDRTAFETRH